MLYKDLHVSFSFSEYLNITMPLKHKIALTKFRTKNTAFPMFYKVEGETC